MNFRRFMLPQKTRLPRFMWVAVVAVIVGLSGCTATSPLMARPFVESGTVMLPSVKKPKVEIIKVDVVDNPHLFVFDETPVYEDGAPAHGNTFITQGYIYPHG